VRGLASSAPKAAQAHYRILRSSQIASGAARYRSHTLRSQRAGLANHQTACWAPKVVLQVVLIGPGLGRDRATHPGVLPTIQAEEAGSSSPTVVSLAAPPRPVTSHSSVLEVVFDRAVDQVGPDPRASPASAFVRSQMGSEVAMVLAPAPVPVQVHLHSYAVQVARPAPAATPHPAASATHQDP